MVAKPAQTAAQIIYDVAHACGINPRVLLVVLQKEQGLIQSVNPTPYMYKAAMGFGCPDSDPAICGKVHSGLFNQLYKAAGQLQWYGDPRSSFTYLKVGRTSNIRYSPNASCGTKPVLIKSIATTALYYYTPYTPNDAALNNLYGSETLAAHTVTETSGASTPTGSVALSAAASCSRALRAAPI
jgi:hypothetical protein